MAPQLNNFGHRLVNALSSGLALIQADESTAPSEASIQVS